MQPENELCSLCKRPPWPSKDQYGMRRCRHGEMHYDDGSWRFCPNYMALLEEENAA